MFDVRKVQVGSKAYWYLTLDGVDVPYAQAEPDRKPAWKRKLDAAKVAKSLNDGDVTLAELQACRFVAKKKSPEEVEIAKTIRSQINFQELWALGADRYTVLGRTDERRGGLQFKVSLFGNFACQVSIELDASDTYKVSLLTMQDNLLRTVDYIYADMLTETVVTFVEEHFAKFR